MDLPDFIGLYLRMRERELEQRVWDIWLARYPHMTQETYISYEEMLATVKQTETTPEGDTANGMYVDQVFL